MVVKWNQVHRLGYTKQQTFAGAHCIIVQCTCFWCCLYLVYFQPIVAAFEIPPLRRISSPAPSFILRSVNVTLALVQFIFSCFMIVIFYLFGMLLSSNLPTFIPFPPNFSSFGALLWFLSQFSSEFFFFHVHKPHMKKNIPRYIEASKKNEKCNENNSDSYLKSFALQWLNWMHLFPLAIHTIFSIALLFLCILYYKTGSLFSIVVHSTRK